MRILWLSRHELTGEQKKDLLERVARWESGYQSQRIEVQDLDVLHLNVTLPAASLEAVQAIQDLLREWHSHHLAAVLPSHVAAKLVACKITLGKPNVVIWLPVNKPVQAPTGSSGPRRFLHSHWEAF